MLTGRMSGGGTPWSSRPKPCVGSPQEPHQEIVPRPPRCSFLQEINWLFLQTWFRARQSFAVRGGFKVSIGEPDLKKRINFWIPSPGVHAEPDAWLDHAQNLPLPMFFSFSLTFHTRQLPTGWGTSWVKPPPHEHARTNPSQLSLLNRPRSPVWVRGRTWSSQSSSGCISLRRIRICLLTQPCN